METNEKGEVVSELDSKEPLKDGVNESLDENSNDPKGLSETTKETESEENQEESSEENQEENSEEEYDDDDEQTTILTADMMGVPKQESSAPSGQGMNGMPEINGGIKGQPGHNNNGAMYGVPHPIEGQGMSQPLPGMNGQPFSGGYGQPGPNMQGATYGQPGQNMQGAMYGQPGPNMQGAMYGQPGQNNNGNIYGQPAPGISNMNQPPVSNGYGGPENMGYYQQGQPVERQPMDPIKKAKIIRGFKVVSLAIAAIAVVTVLIFLIVAVLIPGGSKYSGSAEKGYKDVSSVTDAEPDEKSYTDADDDTDIDGERKED